ncbi:vWA domain-containing protein [Pseudidiomarina terrestris]|uniref:VWA domain-containing protein n=1 Tax=Pseudidiomarina terrestris TaxID=2820060 RepID=A0AAW7QV61_9GAMM|nr:MULTISPECIES: VWA domain-containing protein [unclassified Pseudidiomarina]MDN7123291.1 VWA domain-containing protein [Pseudidiomarina sp. 1APP75-32.1]MDN7127876.1 VWA domain-containing protein [Pseudidiomarina sp. 1APR75-33.1]MDN7128983.1 VWA domain-containing protein [Pseudidiomarina sp. 1APR75-15]MDN7134754.1 VWA domain-containing protein [Pseudidiomarina sp. 1ASP75-5]MEA3587458.1 VWA domain-containing protein [Pseudidiomarina sp. 1APP75-27a]
MIEFGWPWLALAWILGPLLWWLRRPQQRQFSTLRVPHLAQASSQPDPAARQWWSALLAILIWTLLVAAASRPQWLGEPVQIRSEAREMVLAVDLSGSMEIADMRIDNQEVNRLTMVKHVVSDFITRRKGDKLGLILFADTAYVQSPITYDLRTVEQLLSEAQLRLIGERTAIGDAVALAVKRFRDNEQSNKILILLTDGQNTAGNVSPGQARQLAAYYGVKIYAIGVGAEEVLVDSFFGQRKVNPSRDLDEDMLRGLAEATGGEYFRARSTEELEAIYETLDRYEPVTGDEQLRRPQTELFYWPVGAALLLLLVLCLAKLAGRRSRGAF